MPPLLLIGILFFSFSGREYISNLNLKYLILLHVVRVPVEFVLFWLFLYNTVPELMTFEGRNLDIFSGLTAPRIYYFGIIKKRLSYQIIILWNLLCLLLLFNIIIHAILSAPSPFQLLAFDQPNVAVLYFPFTWLPGCIVPLVLFSHIAAIKIILASRKSMTHPISNPAFK
jgi:hypothetical protein